MAGRLVLSQKRVNPAMLFHHSVNLLYPHITASAVFYYCLISVTLCRSVHVDWMLFAAQECVQDAFYSCDSSKKHVASNCLAALLESEGHVNVQHDRRAGKTPSGVVLNFHLLGHIVLCTTTELSFHFYILQAPFPLCCFSTP